MKITSLNTVPRVQESDTIITQMLIGADTKAHEALLMGYGEFAPGARIPAAGFSVHEEDEINYFLSGSLKVVSQGQTQVLQSGDCLYTPAGEEHYAYNDSDETCKLLFISVKTI